jgi:hypothetical protein
MKEEKREVRLIVEEKDPKWEKKNRIVTFLSYIIFMKKKYRRCEMKKSISVTLVTLLMVFGACVGLYGDDNYSYRTMAWTMASIDAGHVLDYTDVSIDQYEYWLKILDSQVIETKTQIADMTLTAQQALRGIKISLKTLMIYAAMSMPDDANGNVSYATLITCVVMAVQLTN